MKTVSASPQTVQHDWYSVNASGRILGRLASVIAHYLRGKHKPEYTPHVDVGDYIIVTNVEKLRVTGKKLSDKKYYRHTGYPGGIKEVTLAKLLAERPERVLELAVKRMLPRNPLGRAMFKKLKVYVGQDHPHMAQQPKDLPIEE